MAGYGKIVGCCRQAVEDGLRYAWVGKSGLFTPFFLAQVLEAMYTLSRKPLYQSCLIDFAARQLFGIQLSPANCFRTHLIINSLSLYLSFIQL